MRERLQSICPECGYAFERDDSMAACTDCQPRRTHRPNHYGKGSSTARGYDYRWRKLSEQARRLSPQCEDCGAVEDLTTDHTAEAWTRRAQRKAIRLRDVAVVCRRCNAERGAARGARAGDHQRWERPDLDVLADDLDRDVAQGLEDPERE